MFAFRRLLTSAARVGKSLPQIKQKHTLPSLPYDYNALEPVICCEIMQLHHLKHHQGYVNALNAVEEKIKEAGMRSDFAAIISLSNNLKFNGGGHLNHSIFWENMSPNGGHPCGELLTAICQQFGSIDNFMNQMSSMAVSIQGSGWAWLGFNPQTRRLELATCANQDPLQPTTGLIPLLGIDVWEHAYYIQYKNVRAEYVKQFWNIVNWNNVLERYHEAVKC